MTVGRSSKPVISEPSVALTAYCVSSIAMTIMNKYVLSGHKFHLNFFLLMVQIFSSLIGAASDITFSLPGYTWMVINCAVSAGYILYMRIVIRKVEFADFDSVYYNNTLATPVMAILSLLTENWAEFASDYFGTGPLVAERNALFLGMLASSIAAFAISYSTAWSVRVASSTTYSMVGALNKLPVAASGIIFFAADRKAANIGNVMSIMVAFISGIVYSIASIRQKQKKTIEETLLAPGDSVNMRDLK